MKCAVLNEDIKLDCVSKIAVIDWHDNYSVMYVVNAKKNGREKTLHFYLEVLGKLEQEE